MAKKSIASTLVMPPIYGRVREILEAARSTISRTVNTTQVIANWLIGREIVEEEQQGKKRAGYGAELLADLAARLKSEFGAGYGVPWRRCRKFRGSASEFGCLSVFPRHTLAGIGCHFDAGATQPAPVLDALPPIAACEPPRSA